MAQEKNRIKLEDTFMDVMMKMSEGNPGAIYVMAQMLKYGRFIDPTPEPVLKIMHLDGMGIYGSQIWVLYKDICGESLVNLLALLRYRQLGFISDERLFDKGHDFETIKAAVKERVPNFNTEVGHALYS
jgi:hypothetical protein